MSDTIKAKCANYLAGCAYVVIAVVIVALIFHR